VADNHLATIAVVRLLNTISKSSVGNNATYAS